MKVNLKLIRLSWVLYELAGAVFLTNLFFFYFFSVNRKCLGIYYNLALGCTFWASTLLMPILGEISDRLKRRMPFLIGLTAGCVITAILSEIIKGACFGLFLSALSFCFYQLAHVIYNTLLIRVSTPQTLGRTSGLGTCSGYVGIILGLALLKPELDLRQTVNIAWPNTMIFLALSCPALIFIKDQPHPRIFKAQLQIKYITSKLWQNLLKIYQDHQLSGFLLSAFLCLSAVNAVLIHAGIYITRLIHFNAQGLVDLALASIIAAVISSYIFGYLIDRWKSKQVLSFILRLWCINLFFLGITAQGWMLWIIGLLSGICLGATWTTLRTMLIELAGFEKIGQMFGLLGLLQACSLISGIMIWEVITCCFFKGLENIGYRLAMGALFLFMLYAYRALEKTRA